VDLWSIHNGHGPQRPDYARYRLAFVFALAHAREVTKCNRAVTPGPAPQPDIRAQVQALRETFPRHKFVLFNEGNIQVTRQDDTARVPGWLLISSDPEKIRADFEGRP